MKKIIYSNLIIFLIFSSFVFAETTVFENNNAIYVASYHDGWVTYEGTMKINTNEKIGNYVITGGWIRYQIPDISGSEKTEYAKKVASEEMEAFLTYKDTYIPFKSKTVFSYDYTRLYLGGSTTSVLENQKSKISHISGEYHY